MSLFPMGVQGCALKTCDFFVVNVSLDFSETAHLVLCLVAYKLFPVGLLIYLHAVRPREPLAGVTKSDFYSLLNLLMMASNIFIFNLHD